MKKFTAIIVVLSLCLAFAGCTAAIGSASTPTDISTDTDTATNEFTIIIPETTETTEAPTTVSTEETLPDIPNAKEFPEIEWPTFGAATKIPTPDWSNHGEILIDSETGFWGQIGYSTLDNYTAYVKACQEAGYIEDYYNVAGYMYYGANTDGYAVQLTYNQYEHYVAIQVTHDAASWNKWWVEETETAETETN